MYIYIHCAGILSYERGKGKGRQTGARKAQQILSVFMWIINAIYIKCREIKLICLPT